MSQIKVKKIGQRWVLYNPELMTEVKEELFSCKAVHEKGLVTGSADGRGETCFYKSGETKWALRHYLRGGLIARFLNDKYFGVQLKNTRAWKEWYLLNEMNALDLPVPTPVAASVIKKGIFYNADLITEYIESTRTMSDVLESEAINSEVWKKIGQTIRQFHDNAVYHSDLNARNILLDENEKVYLIDFDQCSFKKGEAWKVKNLERLKRSLHKFKSKQAGFYFEEKNWEVLLHGYN